MVRIAVNLTFAVAILGGCNNQPAPSVHPPAGELAVQEVHSSPANHDANGEPLDSGPPLIAPFGDVTRDTGIDFSYSNGRSANEFAIIESLGGGVGVVDFDRDGRLDLMFAGGGTLTDKTVGTRPCGLFRNLGQMRFQAATIPALAAADQYFTNGISVADFDADGFQDLSISGYGGVQLLRNQGDGTFARLPPLITNEAQAWSSSLAWADLDNNGHLDLYVTHYVDWSWSKHPSCRGQGDVEREVCAPREFVGMPDVVYFNDGQNFQKKSAAIGLASDGKGLGVALCDLNGDQFVDIYVANDTTDNRLYLNNGRGEFSETAALAGVSGDDAGVSNGSMGIAIVDANGDGRPDVFVTNFERELNALYRNEGGGFFTYVSRTSGFAAYPAGFVGFGTVVLDYNFDGVQDLVVANGHVSYASPHSLFKQKSLIFRNQGATFERLPESGYFADPHTGRGLAAGDLDNDGAVDLVFSNLQEPVAVVRMPPPVAIAWGIIRLVGTRSNRDAVGATVHWRPAGSKPQTFQVCGGCSYLSHSDQRMHLYWPEGSAVATDQHPLEVHWPSGEVEEFIIFPNMENVLVQGAGEREISADEKL